MSEGGCRKAEGGRREVEGLILRPAQSGGAPSPLGWRGGWNRVGLVGWERAHFGRAARVACCAVEKGLALMVADQDDGWRVARRGWARAVVVLVGVVVGAARPGVCRADVDPVSGIDFVRIGAVGDAAWAGNGTVTDRAIGRGGVNYEYSIGRLEVTTAEWVEFLNAALDRPVNDRIPFVSVPSFWGGAATSPTNPGGLRFTVRPGQGLLPVGDIDWRMSAVLCNWYHNGKSLDRSAFLNGAYDVSTFGYQGNRFTDQVAHNAGARYWIPTWDEWLKAAHYDPNKNGPDEPGWWAFSYKSDVQLLGGPPGMGIANFGFTNGAFSVPLGAYPQSQSPWGLLDVAGGTSEWTESIVTTSDGVRNRIYDGSWWSSDQFYGVADATYGESADFPHIAGYQNGVRIASSVPAPGAWVVGVGVCVVVGCRRRVRPRGGVVGCVLVLGVCVQVRS